MKTTEINKKLAKFLGGYEVEEFEDFYNDWNWLMLVVEKIEKTNEGTLIIQSKGIVDISFNGETRTFYTGNLIDNVYEACNIFVDWYNEQNL